MASRVNIGAFRDSIVLRYVIGQTKDSLGGKVLTFESYTIFADVQQASSSDLYRLGKDTLTNGYKVTCRPPTDARTYDVIYNGNSYKVISEQRDKVNQFLHLIITKDD
jgi:SPP1 family predicted phage head-tail adaptor